MLDDHKVAIAGIDRARTRREVARLRRFQRGLARAFAWPADAVADLADAVTVCRCEGISAGELRAAISELDEDVQLDFGSALGGRALLFYRFVWRGEKMLQIELSENDPDARD